jgi:acyl-CoA thioester hydrolase
MGFNDVTEAVLKVRTYECDAYGHVNNAVYLNYLEYGRMAVLEKAGLTLAAMKKRGVIIVVRRIEIDYKAPAQEAEALVIRTRLKETNKMKGVFYQEIVKQEDDRLVAKAEVTWVFVDTKGKLIPIPDFFRVALGF